MAASIIAPVPRIVAPAEPEGLVQRPAPPTFSVAIPVYQAAGTIADAIVSALEQTVRAHEILVVDDGSTDDLDAALRPFLEDIRLIRKPNGGNSSALNTALAAATGEFMVILDADDRYHPGRLEALSAIAVERPDLDLVTTDARFVVNGRVAGTYYGHNQFATDDQRVAILRSCFVGGWPAVRRSLLEDLGGFDVDLRTGADWDCWLRAIFAGAKAGLVPEPLYDYRIAGTGLTGNRIESLWDRVRLLEKAGRREALTADERVVLAEALRSYRSKATLAEARRCISGPPRRRRLAELATQRGLGRRTRLLVTVALAAPRLGRRLVPVDAPPEARFDDSR